METTTMQWRRVLLVTWLQTIVIEPQQQEMQVPQKKLQKRSYQEQDSGKEHKG